MQTKMCKLVYNKHVFMTSQRKKKGLYDVKKHLYQRVQRTILGLNQAFEANHNTDYKRVKKTVQTYTVQSDGIILGLQKGLQ